MQGIDDDLDPFLFLVFQELILRTTLESNFDRLFEGQQDYPVAGSSRRMCMLSMFAFKKSLFNGDFFCSLDDILNYSAQFFLLKNATYNAILSFKVGVIPSGVLARWSMRVAMGMSSSVLSASWYSI